MRQELRRQHSVHTCLAGKDHRRRAQLRHHTRTRFATAASETGPRLRADGCGRRPVTQTRTPTAHHQHSVDVPVPLPRRALAYVGQEKIRPEAGWSEDEYSFAKDWEPATRHMNSTSYSTSTPISGATNASRLRECSLRLQTLKSLTARTLITTFRAN